MTEFEKIKAELHKLINGLDGIKCNQIYGNIFREMEQIEQLKSLLKKLQKNPTLEEQLQELGFTRWTIELDPSNLPKLCYSFSLDKKIIFLNRKCLFVADYIDCNKLIIRMDNPEEVIRCAKFLKELQNNEN